MLTAGIDVGSSATKAVLFGRDGIVGSAVVPTGVDSTESGLRAYRQALCAADATERDVAYVVGTGYGRVNVEFANHTVTEISCHARGVNFELPEVRTILDMGGQDCKVIRCDEHGRTVDFLMNDRCAAGTGRYLERIAGILQIPLSEIGPRSLDIVDAPAKVSAYCTVFAEHDAVLLIRRGTAANDILAGVSDGLVQRTCDLVRRLGVESEFAISGGIAQNIGIVTRIERELDVRARTLTEPQIAGALGAALIARDRAAKGC